MSIELSLLALTAIAPTPVRQPIRSMVSPIRKAPSASSRLWVFSEARVVKKSTMMLPPFNWHQGRNSATATAQPICTSSKSPWIGFMPMARTQTLYTDMRASAVMMVPAM